MLCAEGKSILGIPQCFSFCDRSMVTNFSFLPKPSNYKYANIFHYLQNYTSMISYCLKSYPLKTIFLSLVHNIKVRYVHCKQHVKLTLQFEQRLLDFLAQHLLLFHRARYIHRTFLLQIKQQIC